MVAAAASGLVANRFLFEGYLSKTQGKRLNTLKYLNSTGAAAVIFENPKRVERTLFDIQNVYGKDVEIYIGTELTKLHEKNIRGSVSYLLEKFEDQEIDLRGEVTMVIAGKTLSEEDLEQKARIGDLNREVNVIDAIKNLSKMKLFNESQLRKIMKDSFNLNKHEIKKVMTEVIYQDKRSDDDLVSSVFKDKKMPDKFYDVYKSMQKEKTF